MVVPESRAGALVATARARSRERVLMGTILLAGLALRLFGIYWGLPERDNLNPDEITVLEVVDTLS